MIKLLEKIKKSRFLRVMFSRKTVVICFIVLLAMIIMSVCAPLFTSYDPNNNSFSEMLQGPSKEHIFGTDALGRDVYTRLLYGGRVSFAVGLLSVAIAACVGIVLGMISGMSNKAIDGLIMRIMDAIGSIPMIILCLFLGTILGSGLFNICLAIGISMVPSYARLTRACALRIRESDYFTASRLCGASRTFVMFRHMLPNCISLCIVNMCTMIGMSIMTESSLSYLGMGVTPPTATWGSMVSEGYIYLNSNPVIAIVPGICIMVVVLCCNILGDAVRDAADPKLRGTLGKRKKIRNVFSSKPCQGGAADA